MACFPRRLAFALALVLPVACFSEPPTVGSGGTNGDACPIGSSGCACTDGNGCDAGLRCLEPAKVCIDLDCTPGEGMCSCGTAMSCANGYVCVDDYCQPIGSSSTTSVDPSTPSDPSTPGTMGEVTFDPGTGVPPTSGEVTSISVGGTTVGSSCYACLMSAATGDCALHYTSCACGATLECFANQISPTCCDDQPPPTMEWNAFADCAQHCQNDCGPLMCAYAEVGGTLKMDVNW